MYDIVLTYMNYVNGYISGAEYQLACGYIGSYLMKHDIKVHQYINKAPANINKIIFDLNQMLCENYFFYINEYNYFVTKTIINEIKKRKASAKIFIGGSSAEYIGKHYMNEIDADICLTYAAPFSLLRLINKDNSSNINNIIYREEDTVITTESKCFEYSLDDLGLPYSSNFIPPIEIQNVGMITSMGCYGDCSFCSYKKESKSFKLHSIDSVLYELEYISRYIHGKNVYLNFLDDCFSMSKHRTEKLCSELLKQTYKYRYWCCTRADLLTENVVDLMVECNFKEIVIGLETASVEVMKHLGKVIKNNSESEYINQVTKGYELCKKKDMNPFLSVNFGLPYESYETATSTINYINQNNMQKNVSICFTTSFPGSKIFENRAQYNIIKEESPNKLPFRTFYPDYVRKLYPFLKELNNGEEYIKNIAIKMIDIFTNISEYVNYSNKVTCIFVRQLDKNDLLFIGKNIDINGTVFIESKGIKIKKQLYCDNRKILKIKNNQYDENLKNAYSQNCYLPNQIFYQLIKEYIYVQNNDDYIPQAVKVKIRNLKMVQDYELLAEEAKLFYETNIIYIKNMLKGIVINSCRFMKECNKFNIDRVTIVGDDVLSCFCETKDEAKRGIGNLNSGYSDLVNSLGKYSRFIETKCSLCDANSECPRCINIPSCFNKEDYCKYISANIKYLSKYVKFITYFYKKYELSSYDYNARLHVGENQTFIIFNN
ncbi:radical SAM superfamily enzyme YgiQ (UPF0313 family) [Lachnotalea glycerini]|uniref:Radical SAM protein n=1 Tax=Lachnotalea glycerini TaxID=1763509 RepID=A0A255I415_9FIRM|nr:radical SAM protein [Lachnotalea glycerini]PXV93721.1 radical SAM superfamily enzyme YgiQ (UPF0313 family) [Lachnotalea glycerini]RDY32663.1 radical SAM protein [Lachnotalea glycerini]